MMEPPSETPVNSQQPSSSQPDSTNTPNNAQSPSSQRPDSLCASAHMQQSLLINPGTGVCNRTVEVCDAIVALIPQADTCNVVTDSQLAALTGEIDLNNSGITSLQSGDFAGLTSLSSLTLSRNMLTTLPSDIFSGLVGLESLSLSHNRLTMLSANIFSGLPRLNELRLNNNLFTTLPANMFTGLVNLKTLRLQANALTSVAENMFRGLSNLEILDLEFNELTSLPTKIFDGLDLWFLGLEGNRLRVLQAGLFDSVGIDLTLDLSHNELTTLGAGVFANLADVVFLDLAHNRLQSLPAGIFAGLTNMKQLFLEENPGTTFTITMEIQRVGDTNKIVVVVAEGAPFSMTTTISAVGGVLEGGVTTVTVPVGKTTSDEITVTPLDGATVSLGAAPKRPPKNLGYRTAVGSPFGTTSELTRSVNRPPELSVADAKAKEATGTMISFVVTMSKISSSTVKVDYETSDGTATAGEDYIYTSDTLTFLPGDTSKTVQVEILDDSIDDDGETFTLTLSNPSGGNARLRDAVATGTIENTNPVPQAWLARFGRTVASQAVDTITNRLERGGTSHLTVAGLSFTDGKGLPWSREDLETPITALAWTADEPDSMTRSMTGRDVLLGSSFQFSSKAGYGDSAFTAWGRLSTSTFDADADNVHLDSTVTSGFLGADVEGSSWLAGVVVSLSESEGDYTFQESSDRGDVEGSLTSLWPFMRLDLSDKVDVWGLAGYGTGELKLSHHLGSGHVRTYRPDIDMRMIALGARGDVLSAHEPGDLKLALRVNSFWVRTTSDTVHESGSSLLASEADASRLQFLAEGSWDLVMDSGTLMPSLELGIRMDGGDAETGTGIEVSTGFRYWREGFSIDGKVHALVAHEESGYKEWGAAGAVRIQPGKSGRGLSLMLSPSWGAVTGYADRLGSFTHVQGLVPEGEFDPEMRLNAKIGYGIGLTTLQGMVAPYMEVSIADQNVQTWHMGAKGELMSGTELLFEVTRHERGRQDQGAADSLMLRLRKGW